MTSDEKSEAMAAACRDYVVVADGLQLEGKALDEIARYQDQAKRGQVSQVQ
jgi:hypothetical protein